MFLQPFPVIIAWIKNKKVKYLFYIDLKIKNKVPQGWKI